MGERFVIRLPFSAALRVLRGETLRGEDQGVGASGRCRTTKSPSRIDVTTIVPLGKYG